MGVLGAGALADAAETGLAAGEPSWALQLAGHLRELGDASAPSLQARALRELARVEPSSSGRHYFLTMAAEAEGFVLPTNSIANTPSEVLNGIPIENFTRGQQVTRPNCNFDPGLPTKPCMSKSL